MCPWTLIVSNCFDNLLDLNESYCEIDDRFRWMSVGCLEIEIENMLWNRNLLDNLPNVRVDEYVFEFSENVIKIMNLMENPYIDEPKSLQSNTEEEVDDGIQYVVSPIKNYDKCLKFIIIEIYKILNKYYFEDTLKYHETIII